MDPNSVCSICNLKPNVSITLTCCTFSICKEHLDKQIQNGNSIMNCDICSAELNIRNCLNTLRNRRMIEEFEIKSNKLKLEKELQDFDKIKDDPAFYLSQSVEESLNKLKLARETLIFDITKKIDEQYINIVSSIELKEKMLLNDFLKKIEIFKKEEYGKIIPNMDNNNMTNEAKTQILKEKIDNINRIKRFAKMDLNKVVLKMKSQVDINKILPELMIPIYRKNIELLNTLTGHTCFVYCLKVLENGEIISGSSDKTIKLWDKKLVNVKEQFKDTRIMSIV